MPQVHFIGDLDVSSSFTVTAVIFRVTHSPFANSNPNVQILFSKKTIALSICFLASSSGFRCQPPGINIFHISWENLHRLPHPHPCLLHHWHSDFLSPHLGPWRLSQCQERTIPYRCLNSTLLLFPSQASS